MFLHKKIQIYPGDLKKQTILFVYSKNRDIFLLIYQSWKYYPIVKTEAFSLQNSGLYIVQSCTKLRTNNISKIVQENVNPVKKMSKKIKFRTKQSKIDKYCLPLVLTNVTRTFFEHDFWWGKCQILLEEINCIWRPYQKVRRKIS